MTKKSGVIVAHLLNTSVEKRYRRPDTYIFLDTAGKLLAMAQLLWPQVTHKWRLVIFSGMITQWRVTDGKEVTNMIIERFGPIVHQDSLTYGQVRAARLIA